LAAATELRKLVEALMRESSVADSEDFVDEQDVRIDVNRHCKPKPHVHAGRVRLHRSIDELAQLGEVHDVIEAVLNFALRQAEHDAVDEDVLAAGNFRME